VSCLGSGNGNGSPPPETDAERLARIEELLIPMKTVIRSPSRFLAAFRLVSHHATP
jgi:hypothetical protein